MPVKLGSKLPQESAEARIEIVPLIDIMFFLLAAFMLVSLSMVNLKSVKVNLPTAVASAADNNKDTAVLSVDKAGGLWLDQKPLGDNELKAQLSAMAKANPKFRVMLSGDAEARHGAIVHALDLARSAGIEHVAFETKATPAAAKESTQ